MELTSVIGLRNRAGVLEAGCEQLAMGDLAALPMRRAPHVPLLARCWELRHNLTAYDAAYVALAEALDATLLTGDRRLARAAGPTCNIEVLRAAQ